MEIPVPGAIVIRHKPDMSEQMNNMGRIRIIFMIIQDFIYGNASREN